MPQLDGVEATTMLCSSNGTPVTVTIVTQTFVDLFTIQTLPYITVEAGSCINDQGGQVSFKRYRALPWWRVSTKVASYHSNITVHYRGGWLPL